MSLSTKIKEKFASVNYNESAAIQAHNLVCQALNEWIPTVLKVQCSFAGFAGTTPDPVTVDVWTPEVNILPVVPSDFNGWVLALSEAIVLGVTLVGAGAAGVTLSTPILPLEGHFILTQDILSSECSYNWDKVELALKSWFVQVPGRIPASPAVHGAFTGTATQTVNIIT